MLTAAQTRAYLDRIGIEGTPAPTRATLDELVRRHQMAVPFETVRLHRSGATPDLDTDVLFERVVAQRLGGYCFELNKLFQELLSALGFSARPVLCRAVRGREGRMPINHRGIVVALDEGAFSADVGFGGPMPLGALPLLCFGLSFGAALQRWGKRAFWVLWGGFMALSYLGGPMVHMMKNSSENSLLRRMLGAIGRFLAFLPEKAYLYLGGAAMLAAGVFGAVLLLRGSVRHAV